MADVAEINEQSTKDEVNEYVEQVVEEVKAEREGESSSGSSTPSVSSNSSTVKKSDAQIISETAKPAKEKTPAAEKVVEKPAKAESSGSDSWLDDDLKAEVAAYGLKESELADFTSREELERAFRLFDKSALEAGRKALAESEKTEPTRNEKGQFAKVVESITPAKTVDAKDLVYTSSKEGRYEITLGEKGYDDDLVNELTGIRDHYESKLQAYEERFQALEERLFEADAIAKERHFDSLVDSLDHADLFGKTDAETAEEKQRRDDLFVEVETYLAGRRALGRPTDLSESILNRIARSLFAEEFSKKELKQRTRKISKQSNGRQGGGATRPQDPPEDPRDEADRLYKELAQR